MGEIRNAYEVLIEKPEGKKPLGRSGRIWEDNIRMGITEVGWGCVDWFNLDQNRDQ
jgi:hypothetical protein